jgi:uncharacterized membrane protein YhfC
MADKGKKAYKKAKWWQKLIGVPAIVLFFFLWVIDRAIHILMPHNTHRSLKDWLAEPTSFKLTIARIIIFAIPIVVYKIFF